jgi:hypothetical protein
MVFKAKKDGFRWAIIGVVFAVYTGVSLLIYFTERKPDAFYGLALVWVLLSIFIVWLLPATTRYTFLEDHLICQSMGFKKRIYYTTFNKLEPSNGFYSGWKMSTAWKCIVVHYNKYDELLISPENETGFIALFNEKKAQFADQSRPNLLEPDP